MKKMYKVSCCLIVVLGFLLCSVRGFAGSGQMNIDIRNGLIAGDRLSWTGDLYVKEGAGFSGPTAAMHLSWEVDVNPISGGSPATISSFTFAEVTTYIASVFATDEDVVGSLTGANDDGFTLEVFNTATAIGTSYVKIGTISLTFSSAIDLESTFSPRLSTDGFGSFWNDNLANELEIVSADAMATPLPVILTDFTVQKASEGSVLLNWTTANEQSTDYFEVLRSNDGKVFDEVVARMKAAGSSDAEITYRNYDYNPVNGNNYYRLKMYDIGGKATYSEVKVVVFSDWFAQVKVYPTLNTDGVVYVELPDDTGKTELRLMDVSGRQVNTYTEDISQGKTKLTFKNVPPGTYTLKVIHDDSAQVFKIRYTP